MSDQDELEARMKRLGVAQPSGEGDGLEARMKRLGVRDELAERRKDISPIEDAASGVSLGLAKSGYGLAKGIVGLHDMVTGHESDAMKSLRASEQEAQDYYDPQGTAGTVGELGGRIVGEGAQLAAGSGAVLKGLTTVGKVGKLGRAAEAAQAAAKALEVTKESGLVKRVAASTLPALPVDAVLGAGEAGPGENPLKTAAERAALGVAGATVLHLPGAGVRAFERAVDPSLGMMEAGAQGAGATIRAEESALRRSVNSVQAEKVRQIAANELGGEQVLNRRAREAAAKARLARMDAEAELRARDYQLNQAGQAAPLPAEHGRFDANGRPIFDLPGASQDVPLPPAREPVVGVETLTPQTPPPAATTQVRDMGLGRYVEDGPAQNPLGGPELFGADEDATRQLERAAFRRGYPGDWQAGPGLPGHNPDPIPPNRRLGPGGGDEPPPLTNGGGSSPVGGGPGPTPTIHQDRISQIAGQYADALELDDAARAAGGGEGAPAPADISDFQYGSAPSEKVELRPRTPGGRLKNLATATDEELAHEYRAWVDANATENTAESVIEDQSGNVGSQYVGKKTAAAHATGRVVQRQKTLAKVEAELARRRINPADAYQFSMDGTPLSSAGPKLNASGKLVDQNGVELFSGLPIQKAGALLGAHGALTGGVVGGVIGAANNEEHPWQGAAYGAFAGAAAGGALGAFLKPGSVHLSLSPAQAAALDKVGSEIDFDGSLKKAANQAAGVDGAPVASVIGNRLWQMADRIGNAYGIIDRLGRAVDAAPTKNARDVMNMVKSTDHTVGRFYREGTIDPITRQVTGPAYTHIFEPFGNDADALRKFLGYAKARRDVGRVATMGLDAVGGDAAKHAANEAAVLAGDQVPLFRQQADVLQRFTKGIADYAEGSGLWTAKQRAEIEASDAFFLPYQRIMEDPISAGVKGAGGGGVFSVKDGVKRFVGSARDVDNLALTLAEYTQNIVRRADRYRAGAAIIDNVEALGPEGQAILSPLPKGGPLAARKAQAAAMAESWKQVGMSTDAGSALLDAFETNVSRENPVIWRNNPVTGEKDAFQINAPGLLRAAEAMNPEYLPTWLRLSLGPLKGIKRVFTATTTALSPRFAGATNPLRDAVEVFAKTEANVSPADLARGYAESVAHIVGASDLAKEAIDAGLGGTSMFFHDGVPKNVTRSVVQMTAADRARNVLSGLGAPVKGLEKAGEASDLGPRLAEFMATINKYGDKVASGEWTPADLRMRAATNARNVTIDFSNRPGSTILRTFADYVPFFGVGLQAPVSFAQAIQRNPARALSVLSAVGGASALAWAKTNQLPPEQAKAMRDRPATERAAFLLVPFGQSGGVVRFPLGAELGLVHVGVTAALDHFMAEDPHAGALLAESLVRALPPGVGEWASGNWNLPVPGLQQALEIAKNKTDYGDRTIVPRRLQDVVPAERRLDTTAPTYDLMAQGIRKLGAGGRLGQFSPLEAEHLTRGVLSNAAPLATAVTDPLAMMVTGRNSPAQRVPVPTIQSPLNPASAVIGRNPPSGTQSENEYYDTRRVISEAHNTVVQAQRAGDTSRLPELQQYAPLLQPQNTETIKAADAALKMLQTREQRVTAAFRQKQIDGETARDALDKLRYDRQEVYRRATTILRKTGALR